MIIHSSTILSALYIYCVVGVDPNTFTIHLSPAKLNMHVGKLDWTAQLQEYISSQ